MIGTELKRLRKKLGMTQTDFAYFLGFSHPWISKYENMNDSEKDTMQVWLDRKLRKMLEESEEKNERQN